MGGGGAAGCDALVVEGEPSRVLCDGRERALLLGHRRLGGGDGGDGDELSGQLRRVKVEVLEAAPAGGDGGGVHALVDAFDAHPLRLDRVEARV